VKSRARARLRAAGKLAAILLCGIVVGFGLLTAVYALPIEPIAEHVRLSVQSLDGSWATGEIAYEQLVKGYETTQLDNSTDAAMLLEAAYESDLPLTQQVIQTASYGDAGSAYGALLSYGQTGAEGLTAAPAARYWHGFLVYLKPLLYFFSYMDIRVIQMCVQLMLLFAVAAGFYRRRLGRYLPAFALALLAVTPAITGFSLQFSTIYTIFLLAMLVPLFHPRVLDTRFATAAFFLITGMATSYIDYLTYPIAAFGMPFVVCLLVRPAASRKDAARFLLTCLGAWLIGYFGMWAGKWVIAALFGQDEWFVPNLLAKITERSSYEAEGVAISYADVLKRVLSVFAKKAYLLVATAVAAVYAALVVRAALRRAKSTAVRKYSRADGRVISLLVTAALPFGWYLLASNHSYNHAFFTSRALAVSVFALAVLGAMLLQRVRGKVSSEIAKH
jgi:hypothetical protein